ncbi:potassium channel family protein [Streptococcus ferus]|uniref:potassium channel family protein n=1 Tax=Streptococcus ferus TaxID=1345 RepID=UPI00235763CA|nr:NAD-binding protein [Streptococcus ferus]
MRIIIVGCGKVGAYVAKQLLDSRHQVTVIEEKEAILAKNQLDLPNADYRLGDGTSPVLLEKCAIDQVDAIAYLTGQDDVNLVGSTVAKFNYGVPRVVARVNNPKNEWLFDTNMGVDSQVSQASLLASVIINEFNMDSAVTLMKLNHDENAIVELTVPKGSSVEQVAIKDLAIPADTILIAVHRQGENIIPNGQTVLQAKDHILAYTNSSGQKQLEALFT